MFFCFKDSGLSLHIYSHSFKRYYENDEKKTKKKTVGRNVALKTQEAISKSKILRFGRYEQIRSNSFKNRLMQRCLTPKRSTEEIPHTS